MIKTEISGQKSPRLNTLGGNPSEIEKKKVLHGVNPVQGGKEVRDLRFRHTWDIIKAAERELLPDKIMLNMHPQRWTDNPAEWTKELVWQNFKNMVKKWMVSRKAAKPRSRKEGLYFSHGLTLITSDIVLPLPHPSTIFRTYGAGTDGHRHFL